MEPAVAGRAVTWRWRVPRPPPADPLQAFSREEVEVCVSHAKPRQRWGLVAFAVDLLLLAALALTAPGRRLVAWVAGLAGGFVPGGAALTVTAVVLAQALVGLPFSLRAYRQDRRDGLATQRLGGFLGDWLKSRGVALVLTVLPLAGLIAAAHWHPAGYPWVAAAVAALLVVVLGLLGPVVLEPMFNRFAPLEAGPLRERVLTLAAEMRVPVHDVLVSDASRRTTRVNAYVSGLGRTRRVVVYDTLLAGEGSASAGEGSARAGEAQATHDDRARERQDEVALVLAHELAHVRHRDVLFGTVAGALGTGGAVLLVSWLLEQGWMRDWLHVAVRQPPADHGADRPGMAVGSAPRHRTARGAGDPG